MKQQKAFDLLLLAWYIRILTQMAWRWVDPQPCPADCCPFTWGVTVYALGLSVFELSTLLYLHRTALNLRRRFQWDIIAGNAIFHVFKYLVLNPFEIVPAEYVGVAIGLGLGFGDWVYVKYHTKQ